MITIDNVRHATNDEWDYHWLHSECATYYHSREWAELWQAYTNGKVRAGAKLITFSDKKQILLPLMYQHYYGKLVKRYGLAGPPSEINAKYGNWLTDGDLCDDHITLLSEYVMRKHRNLIWQLNPYDENSKKIRFDSRFIRKKPFTWYRIDLTKGEELLLANMTQNCRNKIRQGMNNGLEVIEGNSLHDWKNYYEIYRNTLERWGKKALYVFDWKFFELLFTVYKTHVKLWLTRFNDIPVSGCICYYSNRSIFLFQSASVSEYRFLRPVNLEKYMLIKDGVEKGCRWLDLGTAGKNKGLEEFKKSFGPDVRSCDMIFSWHPIVYVMKKWLR